MTTSNNGIDDSSDINHRATKEATAQTGHFLECGHGSRHCELCKEVKHISSLPLPLPTSIKSLEDNIAHPKHYTFGRIEVIDVIEDWKLNFHRGNALKYIARAGKKDPTKELEDLRKASWYLKREIERLSKE